MEESVAMDGRELMDDLGFLSTFLPLLLITHLFPPVWLEALTVALVMPLPMFTLPLDKMLLRLDKLLLPLESILLPAAGGNE